jgi:hypothetical protein
MIWVYGDGPMWSGGGLGTVYGAAGATRVATNGTLNVTVRDCNEQPIDGVAVTFTPPPGTMTYTAANGAPSPALTATSPPYDYALGLNAPALPTQVTAVKPGYVFKPLEVDVVSGTQVMIVVMHGASQ